MNKTVALCPPTMAALTPHFTYVMPSACCCLSTSGLVPLSSLAQTLLGCGDLQMIFVLRHRECHLVLSRACVGVLVLHGEGEGTLIVVRTGLGWQEHYASWNIPPV